jgi:hypothetical protein
MSERHHGPALLPGRGVFVVARLGGPRAIRHLFATLVILTANSWSSVDGPPKEIGPGSAWAGLRENLLYQPAESLTLGIPKSAAP